MINKIVKEVIRKECRSEALEILEKCDDLGRSEFIRYHDEDKDNICCLHLDWLKDKLVKEGKMKEEGHFGMPKFD